MNEARIAELEQEAGATRRLLERIPEGRLGWRPHPKSMSLMLGRWYDHRAQLGLYRLPDVPVPAVYGNSADEDPLARSGAGRPTRRPRAHLGLGVGAERVGDPRDVVEIRDHLHEVVDVRVREARGPERRQVLRADLLRRRGQLHRVVAERPLARR